MNNKKFTQFKKELRELLNKYNCRISGHIESDTSGIYDDYLVVISHDQNDKVKQYITWL